MNYTATVLYCDRSIDAFGTGFERVFKMCKNELIKRLRISFLSFETEGIDIMVDLDDLFTDHGYFLYMNSDGTFNLSGLWG